MAAHIGKVFENELTKVLKLLKETHLVGYHRLADTGAAGNMIASQPSDYLVALPPGSRSPLADQRMFFLEVKASEIETSLKKDMIRPSQRGAVGSFRVLLNIPYLILFWSSATGDMELWDGVAVQDARINRAHRLAVWRNTGVINKLRTEAVAAMIVDHFAIPLASDTLKSSR